MSTLLESALRDKKRSHDKAARLSWEEKIASVERMQEAAYVIRQSAGGTARVRASEISASQVHAPGALRRRA